jgi:hypothetical protein
MVPPLKDVRLKLRGGPLEIPEGGGGGENSPKKIRAKKNAWKKFAQANSKVQIVLKKNSYRGYMH